MGTKDDLVHILKKIEGLEHRLILIENQLSLTPAISIEKSHTELNAINSDKNKIQPNLEQRIGEYWLPRLGLGVLTIGVLFLLVLPYSDLPNGFPVLLGYLIGISFVGISYYLKKYRKELSIHLIASSLLIFFISTMRMSFFSQLPLVTNTALETSFLTLIALVGFYYAIRVKSLYLIIVNLFLIYSIAVINGHDYFVFIVLLLSTLFILNISIQFKWNYLPVFAIFTTYFLHFNWFLNNPLSGNSIQLLQPSALSLIFILAYLVVFAYGNLKIFNQEEENPVAILASFLNASAGYGLLLIVTFFSFKELFSISQLIGSVLFMTIASVYWLKSKSTYSTSIYALAGYTALTSAILYYFVNPDFFVYLCLQSLIVIVTAIWFRSRFIILSNFMIFFLLSIASLIIAGDNYLLFLIFGVTGLFSARILNWKKEKLKLKTELMRNLYLIISMISFPYALAQGVPQQYVSLSWGLVVLLYFLISAILNIKKYRWMAIMTLGLIVLRIFIIDTVKFDPIYRVLTFMVLAVIILIISLVYARMKNKDLAGDWHIKDFK